MDDYSINLAYLDSKDQNEQLKGLAYFAVFDEPDLNEEIINKLIELAENGSGHISDIASSIISQAVAQREQQAVARMVLKKLESGDENKLNFRDLEWAIKLNDKRFKVALEKYLDRCTESKHISWLVKNLPQAYPDTQQIPLLKTFLAHSDDRVVANTIEGLESLEHPDTFPIFAQMLTHPSHRVRSVTAAALARANPDEARNLLFNMLNQNDPEEIKAACHAIRHLQGEDYLELVLPLLNQPKTREEASRTVAWLIYQRLSSYFQLPEINQRSDLKARIAASVIELLREQCRKHFHSDEDNEENIEQGTCQLIMGQKNLIAIDPLITPEEADKIAEENKHRGINFFTRLIYRPKPEEIILSRSEARFEPFWHMKCEAKVDYVREKSVHLDLDEKVCELKIGDQYFKAEKGQAFVNIDERCVIRKNHNIFIDAVTGEKRDFSELLKNKYSCLKSLEDLEKNEFKLLPARVKASILVREMVFDTMQPLKAIEILGQSLKIDKLNLCFRPVYIYEYIWEAKETKVVFEIDGVTGKINEGRVLKNINSKEFMSEASLFDIGADAIGLVVPGGEIAAKIARAFIGRKK
ncbi:MAG: HEAT repeat domain-containing protein [Candidatus Rifleibacteriota bacterium]